MKKIRLKSFEQTSVIRKFTILFLVASIIPLAVLFYLYHQIQDTGKVELSIQSLQAALIGTALGCGLGYWAIRKIIQEFIETTKSSRLMLVDILGADVLTTASTETNEIILLAQTFRDIKLRLESDNEQLKNLANKDPLTKLYNYRYLNEALTYEIRRAERYGGNLSILVIDVDNFKTYNDTFGHLEGDILLKSIAEIFNNQVRFVDIACRYGGDEFVIILPQTDIAGARFVAEKIKNAINQLNLKMPVTVSIGGAQWKKGYNGLSMIGQADRALYQAKQSGKNVVAIEAII